MPFCTENTFKRWSNCHYITQLFIGFPLLKGESVLEKKNCVKFIIKSSLIASCAWWTVEINVPSPLQQITPRKKIRDPINPGAPKDPPFSAAHFLFFAPLGGYKQSLFFLTKRERHLLNFPFTSDDIVSLICSFYRYPRSMRKKRRPSSHYIKVYSFLVQMSRRNLLYLSDDLLRW